MYWALSEYWRYGEYGEPSGLLRASDTSAVEAVFTPQERARLEALRARLQGLSVDAELDVNDRRLCFARWLVQHGKLAEDV